MSVRRRRGKWGSETMRVLPVALTLAGSVLASSGARAFDAAAAFGARPSAVDVSLSPDGNSIAFVAPTQGMGSVLYTVHVDPGAKPKAALTASGKPTPPAGGGACRNTPRALLRTPDPHESPPQAAAATTQHP